MPQVTVPSYNPPIEGSRSAITYSATVVIADPTPAVGATEVAVCVGDSIPLRRQTEIVSAIKFLVNGIRDRKLLDPQFKGALLYTSVPIDRITEAARKTASDIALVDTGVTDVFIAMGATASDKQHVLPLDTAFDQMIDVLLENIKDQAA
jgi:hypothetical protein